MFINRRTFFKRAAGVAAVAATTAPLAAAVAAPVAPLKPPSALDDLNLRRFLVEFRRAATLFGPTIRYEPADSVTVSRVQIAFQSLLDYYAQKRLLTAGLAYSKITPEPTVSSTSAPYYVYGVDTQMLITFYDGRRMQLDYRIDGYRLHFSEQFI